MDTIHLLFNGFATVCTPTNLFACFLGTFMGTLIGVLPGLGPIGTMAILLPVTFTAGPTTAIIILSAIYYGAQYGGSTTSILVNIPGEVGSIVTCLDGYQMARKGRAGAALGMSAMGSFIGGSLSIIGLMLLTPLMAKLAIGFGPPELFSLIVFALLLVSTLSGGSALKSIIMVILGLFASTIGREAVKGFSRFTLGSITLSDGIGLVPVAVGMFGIAELLTNIEEMPKQEIVKTAIRNLFPTFQDWRDSFWPIIRGAILGFFVGCLPGGGVTVTTFIDYGMERRLSKHPERFGTGIIEGVAGPETANNASTSGSMVPLLSLGLPTNAVMAMLLGAFVIHGIQPGPFFITDHPDIFWGIIASMYIGNVMLVILNLPLIGLWVQLLKIPYRLLFPLIIVFCFIGVYSLNNNIYDLVIMAIFGPIGYFLRKVKYPTGSFLLGLVLGQMMETSLRQSLTISMGSFGIFVQRPLSAILIIMILGMLCFMLLQPIRKKWFPAADDSR